MSTTAAAIAGIGATEFSKNSGRSEMRLAVECITAALVDAGLSPLDIDGFAVLDMEHNSPQDVAHALGVPELRFFAHIPGGGGGGCGAVAVARLAVTSGIADVVVCYRAMNERSGQRFGQPGAYSGMPGTATSYDIAASWVAPFGMATPAAYFAPSARRYMHEYGATSEDFGRVSVGAREFAATNPNAFFFGKPLSIDEHQQSRVIADPLRLFDCCQESDGSVAIIVTSIERARDLKSLPVVISAAAQTIGPDQVGMASPYRGDIADAVETRLLGRQLWAQAGLAPNDMDLAIIYDHFSPAVLMSLEALGFCKPGEAPGMVRDGVTSRGGTLPVNTHGGQVGEAYLHGYNGIAEAVRQIRGTAVNQVHGARSAIVTSGSHVPTSGLILTGDA